MDDFIGIDWDMKRGSTILRGFYVYRWMMDGTILRSLRASFETKFPNSVNADRNMSGLFLQKPILILTFKIEQGSLIHLFMSYC